MCGIFGFLLNNEKNLDIKKVCDHAIQSQFHRGPDSSGAFFDKNIGLSHTRLSILDIKKGNQPMTDSKNGLTIIFNGEIVNYKNLKKKLNNHYQKFLTDHSDTEVILKLYELYQEKCVNYLHGMFSFAIWDSKKRKLFLARDHLGIKPLYICDTSYGLIFASEIKTICEIKKRILKIENPINENLLNEYLVFGNIYGDQTLFRQIFCLKPGFSLSVEGKRRNYHKYWSPTLNIDEDLKDSSEIEIIERLDDLIKTVFTEWSVSDVETGIFLSSGLDSNLINNVIPNGANIKKFLLNFSSSNENEYQVLKKNFGNEIKNLFIINSSEDEVFTNLNNLISHTYLPLNNYNSLTFLHLCKKVHEHSKIKVLYSGDGSDEIFGGYQRHHDVCKSFELENYGEKRLLLAKNYFTLERMKIFDKSKKDFLNQRLDILSEFKNQKETLNKILINDQMSFLQGYLTRADQIGMMYGQEIRTPFCDERIVSFSNSIKGNMKINLGDRNQPKFKYILKKVAEKYLPKDIVWNPIKSKFPAPISNSFYSGELKNLYIDKIHNNSKISKYYNIDGLKKLLNIHDGSNQTKNDHSNTLGRILSLEIWLNNLI